MKLEFTKKEKRILYVVLCLALLITTIIPGIGFMLRVFGESPKSIEYWAGCIWIALTFWGVLHLGFGKRPK